MSEIKRAQLIPLGTPKDSEKPAKEPRKTVRISVVLPESTEDTCPEYNYKDELAAAKKTGKRKESGATLNGLSRLEDLDDDDDDVRRIARQMEEKYGTGTSTNKKKRKGRKDDYADIGMGYDESDSFIDNTDGYDEMIPQNVTTLHGGFYINSGALEFKTDDEANSDFSSSSSDEENSKKAPSRKRIIESSDETDRENKTESADNSNHVEKKRKIQNGGNGLQPSLKKKFLGQNPLYIKKRRLLDPQKKTVKELLREKREDLNMTVPEELDSTVDEGQKEKKTSTISNVADVIESVVKASSEEVKQVESKISEKVLVNSSSDGESSHDKVTNSVKVDVKLPENLPADILSIITSIKTASEKNVDGKNSFTSEINLLILRLERKCKCLGKPSKTKVYEHLSVFLKCKTENLIRRAKSLVLEDEAKKLKNLLSTLRLEINKTMPSLLESYEKESQRIIQKKFSQESVENEENKSLRMPKRRFQWNDVTKKLLKDILMLKKRCILLEGKSKEDLDAQMTTFLRNEIQSLWPDGWMSMNALNKIYTTYADPKRLLSNGSSISPSTNLQSKNPISTATTTGAVKNLPQNFNNSNLSITPIVPGVKNENNSNKISVGNDVSVSKTCNEASINLSMKSSLPETSQSCDIKPTSPKKEVEVKLKVKPHSELFKSSVSNHVNKMDSTVNLINDDSVIILDSAPINDRFSPNKDKFNAKSDDNYCQVIDLSDKNDFKLKNEIKTQPKREKTISPMMPEQLSHGMKHHDAKNELKAHPKREKTISPMISEQVSHAVKHHDLKNDIKIQPKREKTISPMIPDQLTLVTKHHDVKSDFKTLPKREKTISPMMPDQLSLVTKHHDVKNDFKTHPKREKTISPMMPDQLSHVTKHHDIKNELKTHSKHEKTISPIITEQLSHVSKHHELSITPAYPKVDHAKAKTSCAGDDIQKVMENLKVLQKMSSPKKSVDSSPSSSAVSVIAVNKSFAPKPVHETSTMQRYDYKSSDYNTSFQDEFQKQLFSALNPYSTTSTKSYNSIDRYPHITSSGSNLVAGDKYFQNSNNNYTQSSNGHKSSTSAQQSGTYSILDDMFANLLTQYGYTKEAAASKPQPK